jgi:WD40 repeat protein
MARALGVVAVLVAAGAVAADDPSPLDKVVPAKVPAAVRPPKGLPPDVIAVIGTRGDKVDCFAARPDGRFLALSGPDKGLRVWDLTGLKLAALTRQPDSVVCLAFSPDGKLLAVGDERGTVRVYDKAEAKTPALKATLAAHKDGPVWAVAFAPDGKTLATGGRDKAVRLWDVSKAKGPTAAALTGHESDARGVAFSPDGKWVYSVGGDDGQLRTWDVAAAKSAGSVKAGGRVNGVAVSADGKLVATAGAKGAAKVWALKDGVPGAAAPLEADGRAVLSVGFAPGGSAVAGLVNHSPTEDRVLVWGADGKKTHELKYEQHLTAAGFAGDGRHLVVVTEGPAYLVRLPR